MRLTACACAGAEEDADGTEEGAVLLACAVVVLLVVEAAGCARTLTDWCTSSPLATTWSRGSVVTYSQQSMIVAAVLQRVCLGYSTVVCSQDQPNTYLPTYYLYYIVNVYAYTHLFGHLHA